jgi:DNA-binding transcriptional regulator/RsmH inhibitor MraZ
MIEIWDKEAYEGIINNKNIDFAQLAEEVMGSQKTEDE